MQPFNEIHAGVRELMNLNRLRGVYRMMDVYRGSVTDPRCFNPLLYNSVATCHLQREFTPPEAYEVLVEARNGIADGRFTLERLEGEVFDRPGTATAQEAAMALLQAYAPGAAAEVVRTQARVERNIQRNRWQIRRMRTIGNRVRYAVRNFQRWGGSGRVLSAPGVVAGCASLDVAVADGSDGVAGTHDDPTILDQAMNADCLGSENHLDDPLAEQAHLSEMESKTLRAAGMAGIVEMAALEVESEAAREEAALAAAERMEQQRRRELTRLRQRLDCVAAGGSFAYVDSNGACGAVVSMNDMMQRVADADVPMLW